MEYTGPANENTTYSSNYARVGERVYVTQPGDTSTNTQELGRRDGFLQAYQSTPEDRDHGVMKVSQGRIYLISKSKSSGPRQRSQRVIQKLSPAHAVFYS